MKQYKVTIKAKHVRIEMVFPDRKAAMAYITKVLDQRQVDMYEIKPIETLEVPREKYHA